MKHLKIEGIFEKRFEKLNEAFDMARLHFHEAELEAGSVDVEERNADVLRCQQQLGCEVQGRCGQARSPWRAAGRWC